MTTDEVKSSIALWTEWASKPEVQRYDIALFKIWIQFERFLGEQFVNYAINNGSETGYHPELEIAFKDESQLNAFLRTEKSQYIDYVSKIQNLSKHIFKQDKNPFSIIFEDCVNNQVFHDVFYLRNYIAHESGDAKNRLIKHIFGDRSDMFLEPNEYLLKKEKTSNDTYYTYYVNKIKDMLDLLVNEIH